MDNRIKAVWRWAFGIGSGLLFIIGLAGVPGDIDQWRQWGENAMQFIDHNAARWILGLLGLCGIAIAAVGPHRWREWLQPLIDHWPAAKQFFARPQLQVAAAAAMALPGPPESPPNSDQQLIHALQCDVQQARDRQRSLQQELQVANSTIATLKAAEMGEKQAASTKAAELRKEGERAARLAKLADMKALIREQIDSAPKDYSLQSVEPWCAGTNHLLMSMRLQQLPNHIHHYVQDDEGRRLHQLNIAHLRALFLKVGEGDVDYL